MRCISPLTFRKGKVINTFPCGKCNFCLQNRRNDWTFRIWQEVRASKSAYFITITYNEENVRTIDVQGHKVPTLNKKDFQDFMKRVRKFNESTKANKLEYETSGDWPGIKYYAVGEYGSQTYRPHYHAIITNLKPECVRRLSEIWGRGYVSVGTPDLAGIHYTTKYVIQPTGEDVWTPILPPFSLISKGVGKAYIDTNGWHHKETRQNFVVTDTGRQRLSRYYGDRIWSVRDKLANSQSSVEQSDVLYRKTIAQITNSEDPDRDYEKIIRDRHERIEKSFKATNNKNETI